MNRGTVPWFVPPGAEFDLDIHHGNMHVAAREIWRRRRAWVNGGNTGSWWWGDKADGWAEPQPLDLVDFGMTEYDEPVYWDEVEEWEDLMPPRPALRPVECEFSGFIISECNERNREYAETRANQEQREMVARQVRLARIADLCKPNRMAELALFNMLVPE